MRVWTIALVGLAVVTAQVSLAAAAKLGPENVVALETWVSTVEQHTPGEPDDALRRVAGLTYEQRRDLTDALDVFFSALSGRSPSTANDAEAQVARIGADTSRTPGANRFLERAAVLHGDAIVFAARLPAPPADARDVRTGEPRLVSSTDGEYQGIVRPSWHSTFATALLDRVQPRPSADPFVRRWYHAIVAYLMAYHRYGEAAVPLQHAIELIRDDAVLLFDRACLAEVTGLPRNQQVLMDPRARQADSSAPDSLPGRTGLSQAQRITRSTPTTETAANAEAERLFRRVLAIDVSRADARLRLGRLLVVRKRYAEADVELARTLATTRDRPTAYLAHLFAARANAHLGRLDAARAHVEAALASFPDAQSGLIAQSQLALQRADVAGALAPIERLAAINHARQPADPWLDYDAGPGRDASALLVDLWASVGR